MLQIKMATAIDSIFYHRLRKRVNSWVEKYPRAETTLDWLFLAPDIFYLLAKICSSRWLERRDRWVALAVVGYFISPVDLLPELLTGLPGYVDDVFLTVLFIVQVIDRYHPALLEPFWLSTRPMLETLAQIERRLSRVLDPRLLLNIRYRLRNLYGASGGS